MLCCSRRRKLLRSSFFVAILCFSLCVFILACLQPASVDSVNIIEHVESLVDEQNNHIERQLNRGILNFEHKNDQEQNISELNQEKETFASTVLVNEDTTQTSAVQITEEYATCSGPWPDYPSCEEKMNWMEKNWQKDSCYAGHGVDGTKCSFQDYLSLVENWCPPRPGKERNYEFMEKAVVNSDMNKLLEALGSNAKFNWIKRRIKSLWPKWSDALKQLQRVKPFKHKKKRILVHVGSLSDKSKFHLAENADHGGPLGELVQWSDLIATLHLLGHDIVFTTEHETLRAVLPLPPSSKTGGCPTELEKNFNVVFTDIVGLKQFKQALRNRLQHHQCLFRVLDSFGTEPQFNYKPWKSNSKYKKQAWGNWGLNPRQFMTLYPHTPDNSFLGFVVGSNHTNSHPTPKKKDIALVYGKELYMWKGHYNYLDTISKYLNIHSTVSISAIKGQDNTYESVVPGFVTNHGILNRTALDQLYQSARLFIGLGFPYEGPAPLEAISHGCFFLNPRFEHPLNRDNTDFFKDKPTLRGLTSQNPYVEDFVGEPYIYTVNMLSTNEVDEALQDMLSKETPPPYIPYEYTYEGMLERVAVLLEHQDFCSHGHQWPPASILKARVSNEGESCKQTCHKEGLVCEPQLFASLNTAEALIMHGLKCSTIATENSLHGPSMHSSGRCSLQEQFLLLSCVGEQADTKRLCPCRTFNKGQIALCSECSR